MLMFLLYMADLVGTIKFNAQLAMLVSVLFVCISPLLVMMLEDLLHIERDRYFFKVLKEAFSVLIVATVINIVTPAQKTVYLMAGAYYGEKAITSERVNQVLDSTGTLINNYLQKLIKEDAKPKD